MTSHDSSRRTFLKHGSIGAAVVGAAVAIPTSSADAAEKPVSGAAHNGPFAVWVKDAKSGEIAVLVGETEVVHHDKALAQKLARIAGRGAKS